MKAMRVPAILVCVLSASAACPETSPAEPLPFDRWQYDALAQVLEWTVGWEYLFDSWKPLRAMTRQEFGVAFSRLFDAMLPLDRADFCEAAAAEGVACVWGKVLREFWPEMKGFSMRERLAAVPEGHWLREQAQQLLREIETGKINQPHVTAPDDPFPDVPTHHWAFDAVEKLRKAGIIIGYPSGTFN